MSKNKNKFTVLEGGAAAPNLSESLIKEPRFKDGDDDGEYGELTHFMVELATTGGYVLKFYFDDGCERSHIAVNDDELFFIMKDELGINN